MNLVFSRLSSSLELTPGARETVVWRLCLWMALLRPGGKQREQQRGRSWEPVAAQTEGTEQLADRARPLPLAGELSKFLQLPGVQRRGRRRRRRGSELRCREVGRRRAQARFPVQETGRHRERVAEVQRRRFERDRTHGEARETILLRVV